MKLSIRNRLNIGFTLAIILVLLIGAISFSAFRRQYQQGALVSETYEVVNQLGQIQIILTNMETGRRGFLSTNEKIFLQPYNLGLQKVQAACNRLINLLTNTPLQEKAAAMQHDINELVAFWKSTGGGSGEYTQQNVVALMTAEKKKMDKIGQTISEMLQYENELLTARDVENQRSVNKTKLELAAGILMILGTVIVLIFQIVREFKNRQKAELSLKKNYKELTIVNQENAERNWLLSGLNKVNDVLQAHLDSIALSKEVLATVVRYSGLQSGGFYIYNEERGKLVLASSYGLPASAKKEYVLHEGNIGRAASKKEPFVVSGINAKYATADGAVVREEPVQAMYAPLCYQDELKGIIEVFSFEPVKKRHTKFLKVVCNNIATALHSANEHEKVLQLLDTVQQQKEELDNVNKQLEKFVSMVSHDLKSPLAAIVTILSTLKRNQLIESNPDIHERIEMVSTSSMHLAQMIDSILEYSRQSLSQQKIEETDTFALVKKICFLLHPPKHITIKVSEKMPVIQTRKLKLQQVFQNLISNAIKYNDKSAGLIEVDVVEKEDFYEFSVRDNGPGIAKDDVSRIFRLFEVTGNKSNSDSSTGVGLNIVKIVVEEQGGKIWADSELGVGSTFYFEWKKAPATQ